MQVRQTDGPTDGRAALLHMHRRRALKLNAVIKC